VGKEEKAGTSRISRFLGWLQLLAKIVMVAAILVWLADWAVFRIRIARSSAFDTVQVQEYLSTSLKGNKEEYDYVGTEQISCVRALFPHAGAEPCWWLRRHTVLWE